MISEPFKIKEVKKTQKTLPYERFNILKKAHYNTFHVRSDYVVFEMISRGMSSWSHYQKAGYMIGDEAYAGSRNFLHLQDAARSSLGIERFVPTHNKIGAEKLLCTTMVKPGSIVVHNRGAQSDLAAAVGAVQHDVTCARAASFADMAGFGADIDIKALTNRLDESANVAFVYVETCPDGWHGQPVSLANLKQIRALTAERGVPLVVDLSNVIENAWAIVNHEAKGRPVRDVVREIASLGDIALLDAAQAPRADVGGFIASSVDEYFERFLNEVVVYEGLHTYGGMTGRAMEVFAVGLREMLDDDFIAWHQHQVDELYRMLTEKGVPCHRGGKGVAIDASAFLSHLAPDELPQQTLAACLYIHGGIRSTLETRYPGRPHTASHVILEVPRAAITASQLEAIAGLVGDVYTHRSEVKGLRLVNEPTFHDEAIFEPSHERLFVDFRPASTDYPPPICEAYKIAITEPIAMTSREARVAAIAEAGYNTFLLRSEDVYIDMLTDSGTSAMSCYQWEGMTNSNDTPYSSRHYLDLVEEFSKILGFDYIIPTHQGRAAEHIMSQCMIRPGQTVLSNMYFTTTRLHQEMPGGIFVDVIVDEAHDPTNEFPWKGNIDLDKMEAAIATAGPGNVAYLSLEMSVNMAGGQPFSMDNLKAVSRLCQRHRIPIMFDATRCVENAYMIQRKDERYRHRSVRSILREMLSYGDGCTISCKKDFLVNMGGLLACNSASLYEKFTAMLRTWEGDLTNGGMDPKDIEALHRGLLDSIEDEYIAMRVEQTQQFGLKLREAGVPIVNPPGSHAIFIDARAFLPHLDQDEYPAQALAAAIYLETGVRTMERGNVSKGRNAATGQNFRPALELVRCTISRRVYTSSHLDFAVEGIARLYKNRDKITGLKFTYEPKVLRFFQGRFEPITPWKL